MNSETATIVIDGLVKVAGFALLGFIAWFGFRRNKPALRADELAPIVARLEQVAADLEAARDHIRAGRDDLAATRRELTGADQ